MLSQATIYLLFGGVTLFLALASAFLFWKLTQTENKIKELIQEGQIQDYKEVFSKIKKLEEISKMTIQKTGIVRFNPFNDMGGNQSFIIALLDGKDNGFVISSLFIQEGNRVYTKEVKAGKSDHKLSKEELQAITRAINSK